MNDCRQGVIIDGINSIFCAGYTNSARTLLKAINNRKYIYFLTLKLNFDSFYKNYKKKIEEEQKGMKLFYDYNIFF